MSISKSGIFLYVIQRGHYLLTYNIISKTARWFYLLTHSGDYLLVEHFYSGKNSYCTSLSGYGVALGMKPGSGGFLLFVPTNAGRSLCYFGLLHVEDITPRQSPAAMLDFCFTCPLTPWVIT